MNCDPSVYTPNRPYPGGGVAPWMRRVISVKSLMPLVCLTTVLLCGRTTLASITGPYSADANTVHLYHFDEAAGATSTPNAGTAGNSAHAWNGSGGSPATPTDMLGATGYSASFGNAGDVQTPNAFGYDGDGNGVFEPDAGSSSLSPDGISDSDIVGPDGSFTLEILTKFTAGTSTTYREIMGSDNSSSERGLSFRITSSGILQFRDNNSEDTRVAAPVPTTGAHAFDNDSWFHIAYAYDADGVNGPGTGTGRLFWTKVSDSATSANLLSKQTLSTNSGNPIIPVSFANGPLVFGGENRSGNGASLQGLIDEVRVSNIARGHKDFFFVPEPATGILVGMAGLALLLSGRR